MCFAFLYNFWLTLLSFLEELDNIRMDLQEVGYGYVDWIELAQDRDR